MSADRFLRSRLVIGDACLQRINEPRQGISTSSWWTVAVISTGAEGCLVQASAGMLLHLARCQTNGGNGPIVSFLAILADAAVRSAD